MNKLTNQTPNIKTDFVSSRGAAEMLGIKSTSLPTYKQMEDFPEPYAVIDSISLWLKSDIEAFKNRERKPRGRKKPIERMTPEEAKAAGRLDELMAYLGGVKDENGK
jgi:predicted DNA-binding transcriptional regulator AlpA